MPVPLPLSTRSSRPLFERIPLGRAVLELLDLALPTECAACRRPGSPWCPRCDRALARLARPAAAVSVPSRGGAPVVWVWGDYRPPLDRVVSAWKDEGRRDLNGLLAGLLAKALVDCLDDPTAALSLVPARRGPAPGVSPDLAPRLVVPVPSSRRAVRRRGDAPLESLTVQALTALGSFLAPGPAADLRVDGAARLRFAPALTHTRTVIDQSHLDLEHRRQNLDGSMRVASAFRDAVAGRHCIVVDDVVTTGATVAEAARALRAAGALEVRVAAVAATPRRQDQSGAQPVVQAGPWSVS